MKRSWSHAFLAKPESSHVRSLFARIAGDRIKRRKNATPIIRPADARYFAINRKRRNLAGAVHKRTEADANSAERSVLRAHRCTQRLATPLYDSFIAELEKCVKQHRCGHAFVDYLTKSCFYGDFLTVDYFGNILEKAIPLAVKMERLLQLTQHQRELHIDRLRRAPRGIRKFDAHMRMGSADMKEIFDTWRARPQEWMQCSTYENYKAMLIRGQKRKAQQLAKSAFSNFLFQQSGERFLLHKLIELPIMNQVSSNSVAQPVPTVLMDLINSYEEYKTTSEYQTVVQLSQQHQNLQQRMSHDVCWAQYRDTKGRTLATKVQDGTVHFYDLDSEEQELVEAFETRQSAKALDRLLEQKRPPYRSAS